jgi:hypothetical protein
VGRLGKEWTLSGSILRLRDRFRRELSRSLGGFDGGVINVTIRLRIYRARPGR